MAVGTPVHGGNGGGATTGTTGSFTPAANSLLFVFTATKRATAASVKPTITNSAGLTFTEICDNASVTDPAVRGTLFYAQPGASPVSMTVTATASDAAGVALECFHVTGVETDFSNFDFSGSAVGDPTSTLLSTPAAASTVVSMAFGVTADAFTEPTGYTELFEATTGSGGSIMRLSTAYDAGSAGVNAAWISANTRSQSLAIELKEATAPPPPPPSGGKRPFIGAIGL